MNFCFQFLNELYRRGNLGLVFGVWEFRGFMDFRFTFEYYLLRVVDKLGCVYEGWVDGWCELCLVGNIGVWGLFLLYFNGYFEDGQILKGEVGRS